MNEIFPMEPSEFKNSHSVKSYKKNIRNFNDAEKRIASKLYKISILIFNRIILRFVSKLCQNFIIHICNTVREISRQRASWSARVKFKKGFRIWKYWFLSEFSTTIFKDFMRCRRFRYIHAEGAARALAIILTH